MARLALTAVLLVKLIVVLQLKDHPLLQADAGLDTTVYADLAAHVRSGNLTLGPGLYYVSPLYIYFVAAILSIAESLTAVRIVQAGLGTMAVAFVFIAAREWFGERAAWGAASVAAATGLFTFYESLILQAALDPVLTAAALAALALALKRQRPAWFAVSGAVFGLQTLNRPNVMIPVAAIVIALLLLRRWRHAGLVMAGLFVALVPMLLRNGLVANTWTPFASHGGLNFFIGNNPRADGTYTAVDGITPNIAGQREDARRVAEQAVGRKLDDAAVSGYFYDRGWAWIRSNPPRALALFVTKLHYTFSASHLWLNYSYPFFAYDVPTALAVLVVGPWLLIPLGLSGLMALAPSNRRAEYILWVSFVPAYAVAVAMFFVSERYRLPLLVPLCVGAGAMVAGLYDSVRTRATRRVAASLGLAAVVAVIANWPVGLDDGRLEERVRMAERSIGSGQYAEAERWTGLALQGHPTPGVVRFRIGRALLTQHRVDAALAHLREAAQLDADRAETSFALGQALLEAGQPAEAVPHLQRAVDAGVRRDLAAVDLVRALAGSGRRDEAIQVLRTVSPTRESDSASWHALGLLAQELAQPEVAIDFLRRAVAADPAAHAARRDLGLTLAVHGRTSEAAAAFEESIGLAPDDASAHLNLAVMYAQLQRRDDARRHAKEALRLQPGYPKAIELLKVLR